MIASIIIAPHAAGLSGRTETRDLFSVRPSAAASAFLNFKSLTHVSRLCTLTATGRREVAIEQTCVRRGPVLGGIWKSVRVIRALSTNPARNLILGLGRALQPRKQSRSGLTDAFHLPRSFQNASASYEQEIIGAFGNVRKAFGEIRNVEC